MLRSLKFTLAVALVGAITVSATAAAQGIIEIRDPLRGVTFYSVQISTDQLSELQVGPGRFSDDDRMTLGVSAFVFDELLAPSDYTIWLRHDGPRRWLTGENNRPLVIDFGASSIRPIPLHVLSPTLVTDNGPFVEKLEFALRPDEFQSLVNSIDPVLELTTLLGRIEKPLAAAEVKALKKFDATVLTKRGSGGTGLADAAERIQQ